MTLRKKVIFIVSALVITGMALVGCASLMTQSPDWHPRLSYWLVQNTRR